MAQITIREFELYSTEHPCKHGGCPYPAYDGRPGALPTRCLDHAFSALSTPTKRNSKRCKCRKRFGRHWVDGVLYCELCLTKTWVDPLFTDKSPACCVDGCAQPGRMLCYRTFDPYCERHAAFVGCFRKGMCRIPGCSAPAAKKAVFSIGPVICTYHHIQLASLNGRLICCEPIEATPAHSRVIRNSRTKKLEPSDFLAPYPKSQRTLASRPLVEASGFVTQESNCAPVQTSGSLSQDPQKSTPDHAQDRQSDELCPQHPQEEFGIFDFAEREEVFCLMCECYSCQGLCKMLN